jgi:hypothetical protein
MPIPATPSDPKAAEIPASPEDRLKAAWERNGNLVYIVLGVLAAAVLAKGGLDYYSAQKELTTQQDYAACSAADMLRAFADSHRGHPLAGWPSSGWPTWPTSPGQVRGGGHGLRPGVADLPQGRSSPAPSWGWPWPRPSREGRTDAEAGLRQILGDDEQLKAIRCEAAYHLASLEVSQGRRARSRSLTDQLMQIDPSSPFAERMRSRCARGRARRCPCRRARGALTPAPRQ